jgi:hypothetical protein
MSEDGQWSETPVGVPQGAVVSPLLANVYLHSGLDLWVEAWRKRIALGAIFVVAVRDRWPRFGLERHPEKTRLIECGAQAIANRQQRGEAESPESAVAATPPGAHRDHGPRAGGDRGRFFQLPGSAREPAASGHLPAAGDPPMAAAAPPLQSKNPPELAALHGVDAPLDSHPAHVASVSECAV